MATMTKCIYGGSINGNNRIGGFPFQEVISQQREPSINYHDVDNNNDLSILHRHEGVVIPLGLYLHTQMMSVPGGSSLKTKIIEKTDVISDELFDTLFNSVLVNKSNKKNTKKMKPIDKTRRTRKRV